MPFLIQGGMGAGVSGWPLARAVSSLGQLGVVSGTALDTILVRRLGCGDVGGHLRRAMAAFPLPGIARRVLERYYRPEVDAGETAHRSSQSGARFDPAAHAGGRRHKLLPLPRAKLTREREGLLVLANFVEVFLAKEGHSGAIGINYLHKIQFPLLPSLYGAMLAGVDVVLVGAGIPGDIPGVLDGLSRQQKVHLSMEVLEAGDEKYELTFDPGGLWEEQPEARAPSLNRPRFLAIVSSATLARALLKRAPGGIDGFVVELPIAGGHNAPPRGVQQLSARGEPIYGVRDAIDVAQIRGLGAPFWLAGGYASREQVSAAMAAGAQGVQIGTAFAFCEESGLDPDLRRRFLDALLRGESDVFTDPIASPTDFPFKVAGLAGTLSDPSLYAQRPRVCDMGYLRRAYRKGDGTIDYRCPAEPVDDFVRKGGKVEDTIGRKCLCNALMANIGIGQGRDEYEEPPLLTAGDDLECLKQFISADRPWYHASDVVECLLPNS